MYLQNYNITCFNVMEKSGTCTCLIMKISKNFTMIFIDNILLVLVYPIKLVQVQVYKIFLFVYKTNETSKRKELRNYLL